MKGISRRISKSTKQYIIVCFICLIVFGGAAFGIAFQIISSIKADCNKQLETCYAEMDSNKRTVYITTKDIATGEVLTKDSVEAKYVFATQPQDTYMDERDIGKVVLVDIKSQTQVLKSMITDTVVDDDIREAEYNSILISSNMLENDVVDVRIAYPNGEEYVVLSKKILKGYTGDTADCFFWMTEEEIIRMRCAVVDAILYTGSFLYTTKYIEPNLQEASVVTYTPSVEAVELIQKNPNIVETATNELSVLVRQALENRLARSINKDITTKQWDIMDDSIYQQYNGKKIDTDKQGSESEIDNSDNEADLNTGETLNENTSDETRPAVEEEDNKSNFNSPAPEVGDSSNLPSENPMPDLGDAGLSNEEKEEPYYFSITEG